MYFFSVELSLELMAMRSAVKSSEGRINECVEARIKQQLNKYVTFLGDTGREHFRNVWVILFHCSYV